MLEINPSHPIIVKLIALHEADKDSQEAKDTVNVVFNTAALAAGYTLDNSAEYAKMIIKMMTRMAQN